MAHKLMSKIDLRCFCKCIRDTGVGGVSSTLAGNINNCAAFFFKEYQNVKMFPLM